MSEIIKLKDIPCDFVQIAEELFEEGCWSHNTKHNTANLLQAAIEAGVVSPPVWAIRNIKTGALVERRGVPVLVLDGNPTDSDIWTKEHWKGQTR